MKKHIYYTGLIITVLLLLGGKKETKRLENMMTFAKVYGYVKYFHPSDEASQIDWNKFSIYGASQIDKCTTKSDIIKTLNNLFKPIAPSIKFANNKTDFDVALKNYIPDSSELYKLTYWQHLGVSVGMDNQKTPYKSLRINRNNEMGENQLFDYKPAFGESIIKEIGNGIYCQIPITLYCNKQFSFPQGNEKELNKLNETLKNLIYKKPEDLFLRLGNIINVYNVFQHFYPYFDVVNIVWEKEFKKAIKQSYSDKTNREHLVTLEQFTAPLNDGHIYVENPQLIQDFFVPPISWEWIENQLVITQVHNNKYTIKIGDIVTHINNRKSSDYFKDFYSRVSAGTKGWLNYRANTKSLLGVNGSNISLTIDDRNIELERSMIPYRQTQRLNKKKAKYKKLEKGIWYLNLDIIEMDTINKLLPQLEISKAIIFDLRGRPKGNHRIINHLLAIDDTTKAWMQTPKIVYPDQEKLVGYRNRNWINMIKASKPYLGDKKIIFIINGKAISYAESFMGYIEGYKLATIVGQPTAGTNGDVNPFNTAWWLQNFLDGKESIETRWFPTSWNWDIA